MMKIKIINLKYQIAQEKNDIKLVSFTQNRIPSAKIKIMKSYPIMAAENMSDENPNLYLKNNDNEKN